MACDVSPVAMFFILFTLTWLLVSIKKQVNCDKYNFATKHGEHEYCWRSWIGKEGPPYHPALSGNPPNILLEIFHRHSLSFDRIFQVQILQGPVSLTQSLAGSLICNQRLPQQIFPPAPSTGRALPVMISKHASHYVIGEFLNLDLISVFELKFYLEKGFLSYVWGVME